VLEAIEKCKQEYFAEYRPMYEKLSKESEKLRKAQGSLDKFGDLTLKEHKVDEE
jgi:hypothetical protein